MNSLVRYQLSQKEEFQGRILILTLGKCHELMNNSKDVDDKMLAKAQDIITNPASYKETLAVSVASLLENDNSPNRLDVALVLEDAVLLQTIDDAFDALAGVAK